MTKLEVINYIAENKIVENIVRNVSGEGDDDLKDLCQDIYVDLFTKSENKLISLYENKQLNFFITKIVYNNIFSKTSRYYTTYKKVKLNKVNINELDYDKY